MGKKKKKKKKNASSADGGRSVPGGATPSTSAGISGEPALPPFTGGTSRTRARPALSVDVPEDDLRPHSAADPASLLPHFISPPPAVMLERQDSATSATGGVRFDAAAEGDLVQHMMFRISELEARLAAANIPSAPPTPRSGHGGGGGDIRTLSSSSSSSPTTTTATTTDTGGHHHLLHSGDLRGIMRRGVSSSSSHSSVSNIGYSRTRASTGLTPPPSPRPEHTAELMVDSPFTPSQFKQAETGAGAGTERNLRDSAAARASSHHHRPDPDNASHIRDPPQPGLTPLSLAGTALRTATMSPIVTQSSRKNSHGKSASGGGNRVAAQKSSHGADASHTFRLRQRHAGRGDSGDSGASSSSSSSSSAAASANTTSAAYTSPRRGRISAASPEITFWDYLRVPVADGPMPTEATADEEGKERLRMLTLVRVPYHLEHALHYGLAVCLDSFLFYITLLPLRCVYALFLCAAALCSPRARHRVHGRHFHDIIQIAILVCCTLLLKQVEMSWAYHTLRAQSFLKLYVIFNLFDILDKLMCALGQGIFDSLRWTLEHYKGGRGRISPGSQAGSGSRAGSGGIDSGGAPSGTTTPGSSAGSVGEEGDVPEYSNHDAERIAKHASQVLLFSAASILYTTTHALLSFSRMVALNVAINTQGSSLLTLLISNNFVELKASVFKRFQPENLFQITCSDIVERFHLFIFMFLIMVQNLDKKEDLHTFFLAAPIIIMCEFLVDWVKHCFVSNFNRIPLEVYAKFSAVLRHDLTAGFEKRGGDRRGGGGGGKGTDARSNGTASVEGGAPAPVGNAPTRNHSYRVASRIGLVNLPLACVLVRVLESQFRRHRLVWNYAPVEVGVLVAAVYFFLLSVKVLLGLCLMGHAGQRYRERLEKHEKHTRDEAAARAAGRKTVEDFMKMKRYMIHKSRVPM